MSPLLVVRVSSSDVRAWIWRWIAAGLRPWWVLDVAAVAGVTRPRPGEGDLALLAPVQQVMLDELRSVVNVYAQDRERHHFGDVVEGGQHPFAGLVGHAAEMT